MKKIRLLFYKMFWTDLYYNTKWGFRNLWRYRKVVWNTKDYDYNYSLTMLKFQLELLMVRMENGNEVREDCDLKIEDMKRCVELIDNKQNDDYLTRVGGANFMKYPFELVPHELDANGKPLTYVQVEKRSESEMEFDSSQMGKARKLEQDEWNELWDTIKKGNKSHVGMEGWWT